jgi:hypothetical protein
MLAEIFKVNYERLKKQQSMYLSIISYKPGRWNCITEFCLKNKINLNHMIGLGTDGANSLYGQNHSVVIVKGK